MNPLERLELLKIRHKFLFPATKWQAGPKRARRVWTPSRPFVNASAGIAGHCNDDDRKAWIERPDLSRPTFRERPRRGLSPLTVAAFAAEERVEGCNHLLPAQAWRMAKPIKKKTERKDFAQGALATVLKAAGVKKLAPEKVVKLPQNKPSK